MLLVEELRNYNRENHSFMPYHQIGSLLKIGQDVKISWEDRRFIYIHLLLKSPSLAAVFRPAKLVSRPSVAAWEVQELQWSQGQARSRSGKVKDWPHLHVLGLVLGDVLLGAVVQDALHAEAAHLVNDGGDGAGVLQFESRLHLGWLYRQWRGSPPLPRTGRRRWASSGPRTESCPAPSSRSSSAAKWT